MRLSLVTLGVADMARARRFYEALGFTASSASAPGVTFFDAGGVVLSLYGHRALAEDARLEPEPPPAFRGIALAHNVASEAAVETVIADAVKAGGTCVKPAQKVFWGGTSGYFADPDGHLWEVAHNPFFPLSADGRVRLP